MHLYTRSRPLITHRTLGDHVPDAHDAIETFVKSQSAAAYKSCQENVYSVYRQIIRFSKLPEEGKM